MVIEVSKVNECSYMLYIADCPAKIPTKTEMKIRRVFEIKFHI